MSQRGEKTGTSSSTKAFKREKTGGKFKKA